MKSPKNWMCTCTKHQSCYIWVMTYKNFVIYWIVSSAESPGNIKLNIDASKDGWRTSIAKQTDNCRKPIACMSRQTTDAENKLYNFELETLVTVEAVKRFRNLLHGKHFILVTDCDARCPIWSKRDLNPRIVRWWLLMQEYDFEVQHKLGKLTAHVDALSRNPVNNLPIWYRIDNWRVKICSWCTWTNWNSWWNWCMPRNV